MDEYTKKVISLFTYLKEFSVANQKIVTELDKQLWHIDFSSIPTYEDWMTHSATGITQRKVTVSLDLE